jgi:hypothetical protein
MAFDRKDYGTNKGIPFIKIANRVEVNVNLKWNRVSGPPPVSNNNSSLAVVNCEFSSLILDRATLGHDSHQHAWCSWDSAAC